ncbi:MAG: rhomboid family intramembrane serine protease, partial [Candidatus Promineifilaceae bacterium]
MIEQRQALNKVGRILKSQAIILGGLVAFAWLLEIVDLVFFHNQLNSLGVRPRTLGGLVGIFLMPFLHNGLGHLLANTIPFLVLGWLVMLRKTADFYFVSVIVILVSGFGVWLFGGTNTVHIGASGLVFGYFGFLVLRSYFERSFFSIVIAVIVIFFYGGLIWGVRPAI